jgi:hypothetical protein
MYQQDCTALPKIEGFCQDEVSEGPRLVESIAAVIRALRAEREKPWQFMPANCCRLTFDELGLC